MTETDWLNSDMFDPMFECLEENNPSTRKLRLFNAACVKRFEKLLVDVRSKAAIEFVERLADGMATNEEIQRIREEARNAKDEAKGPVLRRATAAAFAMVQYPNESPLFIAKYTAGLGIHVQSRLADSERSHCILLRDILGNPFRLISIDPRWLTSNVVDLSRAIYDERAFDRMPILADALMDAGCDNEMMINVCRSESPNAALQKMAIGIILGATPP